MDLSGRSLKQYRLVEKLGQGGMGVVYRARDTVLGRDAAVKVLLPEKLHDETLRQRFHREARAASALNHPNIITIYEIGSEDGIEFMAMEYVDGSTLFSVLRSERLSVAKAVGYAIQIAEALAKAHAAGIVHRDLKPGNLMITGDGLIKVLDFGLARLNAAANQMSQAQTTVYVTRIGTVMGTVAYMSPEQARGEEASPQSDVFSLGVVLFEMLSGELPFAGNSEIAFLHNLHFGKPKDLRSLRPDVPPELARIVSRMLQHDLNARSPSMVEVRRELRSFVGAASIFEPEEQSTISLPGVKLPEVPRRTRWLFAALTSVMVLVGAGVLGQRFGVLSSGGAHVPKAGVVATGDDPSLESLEPYELFSRARQYLERFDREDNPKHAIQLLERAVAKDKGFAPGYAALTEAYRHRYKVSPDPQWLKLMQQNAQKALDLNPDLAAAHIAMGLALMEESGRAKESESHLLRAIELDPKNSAAHKWLGVLLTSTKRFDAARKALDQAAQLDPKNWSALLDLGLLHYRQTEFAKAAEVFERARELSPDNQRILANLAAVYYQLDRYDDAASVLQRAIEVQPSAQNWANLGTLWFFQGHYAKALPAFKQARDKAPNIPLYWGNLGDAYRWAPGERANAKEAYAQAIQLLREQLELKPQDAGMLSSLALYLAKSDDKDASRAQLEKLESLNPGGADVLFRIAVAYEICDMRDRALSALQQSVEAGHALKLIRNEPELLRLRSDVRYRQIVASASTKRPA
jgi:serine/threonine-protein kinase